MLRGLLVVLLLAAPRPAAADVTAYLGRPVAAVSVELAGAPVTDPLVLDLIEVRPGAPLSLVQVRETIDHLVGLGRFADVQVYAGPAPGPAGGVHVRWVLVPIRRVAGFAFDGRVELDANRLTRELTEQFGERPPANRAPAMADVLRAFYADRGYRAASIAPVVEPRAAPDEATLRVRIDAGPRTTVGAVEVQGAPLVPPAQVLARLGLERGAPYDRPALEQRADEYEDELRDRGHYEALVEPTVVFSEDGRSASVTLRVEPGPRVRLVFAGDPLPVGQREVLVPIREERSVDLDLLEDAGRNIERALRGDGYRTAQATHTREERDGELVITFTVTRGPLHRVAEVDLDGVSALPRAEVDALVRLARGEPYVDSRVGAVAGAITELYRVRGFAEARVTPDILVRAAEAGAATRPVRVRLVVEEGVQTRVGEVTVEGATGLPAGDLRGALSLTPGRPFYRPLLTADRDTLERLYRNEGYLQARAAAAIDLADEGRSARLRWTVTEGPQTLVDRVLITGNTRTSAEVIRREVPLRTGAPLGEDDVVEAQQRLAALGLFRRVRITELPHGASTSRDVLIEVEEAPATTIAYGGGLEVGRRLRPAGDGGPAEERIDVAPRGFFEIGRRNLWGKNRAVSLFTRVSFRPRDPGVDNLDPTDTGGYGFNEYRVVGTFREPRAFNRAGDAQLTAFVEQAIRTSFNFRRRGVRAEYARRVGDHLTVSTRYSIDRTRLFDEQIQPDDQLLIDRLFPQVRLSTFSGSLLRDSRDDVLDPDSGTVVGIDGSLAPRALGSEVGFARTFLQGFIYRPLPAAPGFVVAAGARVGLAIGFEREVVRTDEDGEPVTGPGGQPIVDVVKDLPASERFFAGGDTTVRGFVLDRLGTVETLNDEGFPTGGNGLVVLNLELRAPYWKGLGLVGFLDAGNVFKRAGDIRLADLRPAAGLGLRYRSPLGPLRVDLGFNLDRRTLAGQQRERGSVWHISLGQAF